MFSEIDSEDEPRLDVRFFIVIRHAEEPGHRGEKAPGPEGCVRSGKDDRLSFSPPLRQRDLVEQLGADVEVRVHLVADAERLRELPAALVEVLERFALPFGLDDRVVNEGHGTEVFLQEQLAFEFDDALADQ